MAQGSRQIQTQAQQQIQTLSPQQILVVKLLELPAIELEDRVRAELLENPALEEGKEDTPGDEYPDTPDAETDSEDGGDTSYDSLSDYLNEDDIPDYKLQENNRSKGEQAEEIPFSDATSFYETLRQQLGEQDLTPHQRELAEYLIGSLDDDGLLRKSLDSISDELAIYAGIDASPEELEEVLKIIQDFDPAGLGARTLQECLLIQIRRKEAQRPMPSPPQYYIEEDILTQCYEEFTRKHYDKIIKGLDIDETALKRAIREITTLDPKPCASWGGSMETALSQIIPDFVVEAVNGELILSMNNRGIPDMRINREYAEMFQDYAGNKANQTTQMKEAVQFVKQKLDSAQWFIDAIKQRQETLQRTMETIILLQRDFFLTGDEATLRPMILKDVAERAGYDISTISRVSNSKYVQTNFGIYPLKYFFSESMQTDSGEEISTREVKKIMKEHIDGEDKRKPLTDEELASILKEKGYIIARRTVAKYREQLGIPVARLRKEI